jgi:hypothetical protein
MPDGDGTSPARWKYGIFALAVGAITVLLAVWIVDQAWSDAPSRAGVLAAVVGAISGLVGAYFGIQVGGAEADATRRQAASEKERANEHKHRAEEAERDKERLLTTVAKLAERMSRGCPGGRRSLRWRSPPEPCRVW